MDNLAGKFQIPAEMEDGHWPTKENLATMQF